MFCWYISSTVPQDVYGSSKLKRPMTLNDTKAWLSHRPTPTKRRGRWVVFANGIICINLSVCSMKLWRHQLLVLWDWHRVKDSLSNLYILLVSWGIVPGVKMNVGIWLHDPRNSGFTKLYMTSSSLQFQTWWPALSCAVFESRSHSPSGPGVANMKGSFYQSGFPLCQTIRQISNVAGKKLYIYALPHLPPKK